jgi:hypothetical protein
LGITAFKGSGLGLTVFMGTGFGATEFKGTKSTGIKASDVVGTPS